jgi:hypothetical protein
MFEKGLDIESGFQLRGVKNTGLSWTPPYLQMEILMTGIAQSDLVIIGKLRDND